MRDRAAARCGEQPAVRPGIPGGHEPGAAAAAASRGARVDRGSGRLRHGGPRECLLRADAAAARLCVRAARAQRREVPRGGSGDRTDAGARAARRARGAPAGGALEPALQRRGVVYHAARLRRAAAGRCGAATVRRALRAAGARRRNGLRTRARRARSPRQPRCWRQLAARAPQGFDSQRRRHPPRPPAAAAAAAPHSGCRHGGVVRRRRGGDDRQRVETGARREARTRVRGKPLHPFALLRDLARRRCFSPTCRGRGSTRTPCRWSRWSRSRTPVPRARSAITAWMARAEESAPPVNLAGVREAGPYALRGAAADRRRAGRFSRHAVPLRGVEEQALSATARITRSASPPPASRRAATDRHAAGARRGAGGRSAARTAR